MGQITQLGMADIARRPKARFVGRLGLLGLFLAAAYVIWKNFRYVSRGMLNPNFEVIHEAYDFNLMTLPLALLFGAVVWLLLGLFWKPGRSASFGQFVVYILCSSSIFLLRYYVTYVEPERLVVRQIRIETPKLSKPVRILHISDIQAGSIGRYQKKIFKEIEALQPDLILNTGDYLQVVPPAEFDIELKKLIELKRKTHPRLGTFGVFGDTELEMYRVPVEELEPMILLSSKNRIIDTGGGLIHLHGLSLYESKELEWAQRSIERWMEGAPSEAFRIVMGHSPNYALGVSEYPIDLCLAGHTHGGQVRLPYYGALTTYSDVPKEWSRGFRSVGIPFLNVSAGAGSNRRHGLPPIRFNCPTEMTLIELVPQT